MSRIQKISRSAAAFGALVLALALALSFSLSANGNAHADAKPTGEIKGISQIQNPTYNGAPQQGYGGTPYCTYRDGAGTDQTYTGPFIATYTGTVYPNTAYEHSYGPTTEAPAQTGSYQVELSLPDSAPCTAAPSGKSFTIDRAPLSATVSPSDENATRPYDYSETPTFTDVKLTAFTGLVPADEGKVDISATGDALKQGGTGAPVPDGNVATDNGKPTGNPTGKPFKATSVSYNNPTSYNYDLQTSPGTYNVSGEVMIVKMPMPDINEATKHEVWNEYGASYSMPVYSIPKGSTSATYTIITDMTETKGLYKAEIVYLNGVAYLKVYANGKGDDAYDAVTVRMSALENHEDFNVTLHVQYFRETVKAIEGVTALPSPVEYDGQPHAGFEGTPTAYYLYNGNRVDYGTLPGETFAISYTGTAADGTRYDSTTPPTNAGTYQVTIAISPGHVCKGSTAFDFTIDKAPAFATIHADAQLQPSGVATIDLASVPGLPGDLGSGPAYAVKSFTSEGLADASVDASGTLVLTAKADALDSATDTVTVGLSAIGNYENSTVEVTVRYARADCVVTGPTAATGLVYNGAPQAGYKGVPAAVYTPAGTTDPLSYNGPFDISYTGTAADGTAYGPTSALPTAAGIYRATFALPQNAPCTGEPLVLDFAIDKASLVFRALDASMTAGDSLPSLGYAAEGLAGSDRVVQEPRLSVAGDTTAAGSLVIAIDGGIVDNQANYYVSYAGGTLTVNSAPKPDPKPLPKPAAKPEAKTALAATGDSALPELLVCVAGAAALAIGIAAGRRRRAKRD